MTVFCTTTFDNNSNRVFYSGQIIQGNVRLTLTERKKVRGVYICLSGDAHTKWSEYVEELRGIGDDRKPVRVLKHYHGHENVLNAKIFVVGGNNGEMYLEPGEHIYYFSFSLPMKIPSSFVGEYGNITYAASVVLAIPWWIDVKFKQPITIIKRLDLNDIPMLHRPVLVEDEHHFYPCCLFGCFASDPLKIKARLPVGGFVSGDTIHLSLTVDNESNRQIPSSTIKLIKSVTYYAQGRTKTETFCTTGEQSTRGVDMNQKRAFSLSLRIPSYSPSDVTACGIIKVCYSLIIKGDSGTCCNDPEIKVPITIGTHPINSLEERTPNRSGYSPPTSVVTIQPSAPKMDDMPNFGDESGPTPQYPADDPPSYTTAIIESVPK